MKHYLVVKSNKLIEANYKLSLAEQRLILMCIAQITSSDLLTTQDTFEVSAQELSQLVNTPLQNAYRDLKMIANRLYERSLIINDPDPDDDTQKLKTRWITSIGYKPDTGKLKLTFAPKILPYLSQLRTQFTQYKLSNVANMTSTYAIHLYELLMQWQGTGKREVEIEWLKQQFQIADNYKSIKDFKKRVLEPAVTQINQHSNLTVKWEQRKTGRRVTHLIFIFSDKSPKKLTPEQWANLPENRSKTVGKTLAEIKKIMRS